MNALEIAASRIDGDLAGRVKEKSLPLAQEEPLKAPLCD
jgi:hypothetical protein